MSIDIDFIHALNAAKPDVFDQTGTPVGTLAPLLKDNALADQVGYVPFNPDQSQKRVYIDADADMQTLKRLDAQDVVLVMADFRDGRTFSQARLLAPRVKRLIIAGDVGADQVGAFLRIGAMHFAPTDPREARALPKSVHDLKGVFDGQDKAQLPVFQATKETV